MRKQLTPEEQDDIIVDVVWEFMEKLHAFSEVEGNKKSEVVYDYFHEFVNGYVEKFAACPKILNIINITSLNKATSETKWVILEEYRLAWHLGEVIDSMNAIQDREKDHEFAEVIATTAVKCIYYLNSVFNTYEKQ